MADQPAHQPPDQPPDRRRPRAARTALTAAVGLLAAAAVALWIASLLVWNWEVDLSKGTAVVSERRGAQAEPALVGLAVAALAAVAAVLATGGWLRRAVGALVLVGGLGTLVVAVGGLAEPRLRRMSDTGFDRYADQVDGWFVQATVAVGLTALAGVLLVVAGVIVLATGHRMPRMGARYQRTPEQARRAESAVWDELDAGRDPTDH